MFGSDVLEIAIGVIFVFLIASLLASAVRELIEAVLKSRAVQLEKGIRQLLDDPDGTEVARHLFNHPQLFSLFPGQYDPTKQLKVSQLSRARNFLGGEGTREGDAKALSWASNLPSYVPSRNFALALLGTVGGSGGAPPTFESLQANVAALPEGKVRQALLGAIGEARGDIDRARLSLEAWFDGNMDRISGWYKRRTQWILLAIGFVIAVALNIDSLAVARELATNTTSRQKVMARVDAAYAGMKADAASGQPLLTSQQSEAEAAGLSRVIGWTGYRARIIDSRRAALAKEAAANPKLRDPASKAAWVRTRLPDPQAYADARIRSNLGSSLIGWIVTALAVSLGAPFWFDLLNKFMVIRSTVKPYEKSAPEGSEDRRGAAPAALQPALAQPSAQGQPPLAQGEPPPLAGPALATVRLALDAGALTNIVLNKNGSPVPVDPDGFVELPLEVGEDHLLEATAIRNVDGAQVSWSRQVHAAMDDDGRPIEAELE